MRAVKILVEACGRLKMCQRLFSRYEPRLLRPLTCNAFGPLTALACHEEIHNCLGPLHLYNLSSGVNHRQRLPRHPTEAFCTTSLSPLQSPYSVSRCRPLTFGRK